MPDYLLTSHAQHDSRGGWRAINAAYDSLLALMPQYGGRALAGGLLLAQYTRHAGQDWLTRLRCLSQAAPRQGSLSAVVEELSSALLPQV
jgi:hypothetical protein